MNVIPRETLASFALASTCAAGCAQSSEADEGTDELAACSLSDDAEWSETVLELRDDGGEWTVEHLLPLGDGAFGVAGSRGFRMTSLDAPVVEVPFGFDCTAPHVNGPEAVVCFANTSHLDQDPNAAEPIHARRTTMSAEGQVSEEVPVSLPLKYAGVEAAVSDGTGGSYVSGWNAPDYAASSPRAGFVSRLSSLGTEQWTRIVGEETDYDAATVVSLDWVEGVAVLEEVAGVWSIVELDQDGERSNETKLAAPVSEEVHRVWSMKGNDQGHVAYVHESSVDRQPELKVLDSEYNLLWTASLPTGTSFGGPRDVAFDGCGDVIAVGYGYDVGTATSHLWLRQYSVDGQLIVARDDFHDHEAGNPARMSAILGFPDGRVLVGGNQYLGGILISDDAVTDEHAPWMQLLRPVQSL
jgi:hypothetical protein